MKAGLGPVNVLGGIGVGGEGWEGVKGWGLNLHTHALKNAKRGTW